MWLLNTWSRWAPDSPSRGAAYPHPSHPTFRCNSASSDLWSCDPARGSWAVFLLVFPQQFRASWRFQASLKLLQHDLTDPATPAAHAWADAGAGASGAAAEAASSPVHAAARARQPDTGHQRQRPHQPAPCHPGTHGGPQGTPDSLPSVQGLSLT